MKGGAYAQKSPSLVSHVRLRSHILPKRFQGSAPADPHAGSSAMTDFFISYTSADRAWAEWIAFTLEEKGYKTVVQAWDFRPGSNFVIEMQTAATEADRTVMVLSPDYLKSQFATPEWAAAFTQDPRSLGRKLVPVMVRQCQPPGLLSPIVHISLIGLDEDAAQAQLLKGVNAERSKPVNRPSFPGARPPQLHASFPGPATPSSSGPKSPTCRR